MTLHTTTAGNGAPLVMVHGWGLNSGIFEPVIAPLAREFRVIGVDLPGHGGSPRGREFSLAGVVDTLAGISSEPACWLGWSLGGTFAIALATRHPERVSRLILVSSTARFVAAPDWRCGMQPDILDQFAGALDDDYPGTVNRFLSLVSRGTRDSSDMLRRLRAAMDLSRKPDPNALRGGLEILRHTDLREQLSHIPVPTLVIHGGRDMLVSVDCGRETCRRIANCETRIFEDAGHAPFLSHQQSFLSAVSEFLHE